MIYFIYIREERIECPLIILTYSVIDCVLCMVPNRSERKGRSNSKTMRKLKQTTLHCRRYPVTASLYIIQHFQPLPNSNNSLPLCIQFSHKIVGLVIQYLVSHNITSYLR